MGARLTSPKTMTHSTVTVQAKSNKAKNRLANCMNGDNRCIVEQQSNGKLFLASVNRTYFFWVEPNDQHWNVIQ